MGTCYLVIPKEKAARIIDSEYDYYVVSSKDSNYIEMEHSFNGRWMITLTDYKYEYERIKLPDGSVRRGLVGSKMEYNKYFNESVIEDCLSEYVERN